MRVPDDDLRAVAERGAGARCDGVAGGQADVTVVQDAVDAGEIDDLDVSSFAVMWASLLDGLVVQVALRDPVVDLDRARKVALDLAYKELGIDAARPRRSPKAS